MDTNNEVSSSEVLLNERIARELFSVMDEQSLFIAFIDNGGNCWLSDENRFSEFFADSEQLKQLCTRTDDGDEPVFSQIDDSGVVASQLRTGQVNCGHVILVLPGYTPEGILTNMELIELLLEQICLIARLIESNGRLQSRQLKQFVTPNSN